LRLSRAQTFTLSLRIPAWSQGASVGVNGRPGPAPLAAGQFAALRREWHSADRIELDLPLGRALESVDTLHPDLVALRVGPLVLMRIIDANVAPPIPRERLLAAQRDPAGAQEWRAGSLKLKAFLDIDAEAYSAYQKVLP
jgi:DUF1680 family protein